jgi:hypothetical protein
MDGVVSLSQRRREELNRRRAVEVELPEWLVRVVEIRAWEANESGAGDEVSFNDVVEWSLVAPITLKDLPVYEEAIPGLSAALSRWIEASTYDP